MDKKKPCRCIGACCSEILSEQLYCEDESMFIETVDSPSYRGRRRLALIVAIIIASLIIFMS